MKNLILASFLTLIFTQDLITTRAFEVSFSYLMEVAEYGDDSSAGGSMDFLEDLCGISNGHIDYAKIYANGWVEFLIECGNGGWAVFYSDNSPEVEGLIIFDEDFEGETLYHLDASLDADIENSYVELWVTGNFGDEVGLIDDLQDQINDLEVQVEELLAELLDCQGCNGDVNTDENIDILDVITVVQHILDTDTDGCIEN